MSAPPAPAWSSAALGLAPALLRVGARQGLRRTGALVLVPTRERALQVGQTLRALAAALPVVPRVAVLHGGVWPNP